MFETLKRLFAGSESPQERSLSPELSTAVLLVEAALSDGIYADVEEAEIITVLCAGFGLEKDRAAELLDEAEDLAEQAVDHHRFTHVVKQLPRDQRLSILEDLWRVVLADGERDAHEDALIRRLAPLLGLSDRDRAQARHAASGR
ncbi:TerB family tellurite resistance protein [Oceanicaulis sp. MMSF_3324]|uniref:tellurite resistance TerB family protein n=1 Tax=Oceanicaulis sp. MMSF_3324 TaxID=3046702 RepID=UPI00273D74D4|nr:TerB family tellurite resistance protein [Oceanicaulis sp. MMSF_3324]